MQTRGTGLGAVVVGGERKFAAGSIKVRDAGQTGLLLAQRVQVQKPARARGTRISAKQRFSPDRSFDPVRTRRKFSFCVHRRQVNAGARLMGWYQSFQWVLNINDYLLRR